MDRRSFFTTMLGGAVAMAALPAFSSTAVPRPAVRIHRTKKTLNFAHFNYHFQGLSINYTKHEYKGIDRKWNSVWTPTKEMEAFFTETATIAYQDGYNAFLNGRRRSALKLHLGRTKIQQYGFQRGSNIDSISTNSGTVYLTNELTVRGVKSKTMNRIMDGFNEILLKVYRQGFDEALADAIADKIRKD